LHLSRVAVDWIAGENGGILKQFSIGIGVRSKEHKRNKVCALVSRSVNVNGSAEEFILPGGESAPIVTTTTSE
jgi:hypothetical protein